MKRAEIFFDAITGIREELIEEALDHRFTKYNTLWRKCLTSAACLALVVLVGFGAIRLGILGGVGGSDNAACDSDRPTDTAAPESAGQSSKPTAPEMPAQDVDKGNASIPGESLSHFTGTVLEVYETSLLVQPHAGESILNSADRIAVPLTGVKNLWAIQVGDDIAVTYAGGVQETYPAMLMQVLEIVPAA